MTIEIICSYHLFIFQVSCSDYERIQDNSVRVYAGLNCTTFA